jgi:hypothetical protein
VNIFGPRVLIDEDASAEKAGFFTVINEKNDGVARLRERLADARDLEDGGGAGTIVESAGAGGDGIVMRGEKNCGAWLCTVETREDILDRATVALFIAGETGLHSWRVAGAGKFGEDAAADYVVLSTTGGVRDAIAN